MTVRDYSGREKRELGRQDNTPPQRILFALDLDDARSEQSTWEGQRRAPASPSPHNTRSGILQFIRTARERIGAGRYLEPRRESAPRLNLCRVRCTR
jgi:hypothetical protein